MFWDLALVKWASVGGRIAVEKQPAYKQSTNQSWAQGAVWAKKEEENSLLQAMVHQIKFLQLTCGLWTLEAIVGFGSKYNLE